MKVFLIGAAHIMKKKINPDSMERHVLSALEQMGISAKYFCALGNSFINQKLTRIKDLVLQGLLREPERLLEKRLFQQIKNTKPDLIMVLLGTYLSPKTVQRLRIIHNGPIVCWCQDSLVNMGRQYLIGSRYDHIYLKDQYFIKILKNYTRSTNIHYLAEACNPQIHRTVIAEAKERNKYLCDITIAATLYYYRYEILTALKDFDLKIWGRVPDWLLNELYLKVMSKPVSR